MGSKNWSQDEVDYLEDKWGIVSIPGIAQNLERSVNAVKTKAGRIGLTRHLHSGPDVTFNQLCYALGSAGSYSWKRDRWMKHGLPLKKKKVVNQSFYVIDIDDFWKWAEQHQLLLDFSKFEINMLGKEPHWVAKKRAIDVRESFNKRPWTEKDDGLLISLLNQYQFTYDELCRRLNRTEGAIKRRIGTLGLLQRPVRQYTRHWTDDETRTLLEMRVDGHCWEVIGRALCRSGSACRGKFERLQNPESSKRYYQKVGDVWNGINSVSAEQLLCEMKG